EKTHQASRKKADLCGKPSGRQTHVGRGKLTEFQFCEVFRGDCVADLVMQGPVRACDRRTQGGNPDHSRELLSWNPRKPTARSDRSTGLDARVGALAEQVRVTAADRLDLRGQEFLDLLLRPPGEVPLRHHLVEVDLLEQWVALQAGQQVVARR